MKDSKKNKKISILGLGYVGLPLLIQLENKTNYESVGFDISKRVIGLIKDGKCPVIDEITIKEFNDSKKLNVDNESEIMKDSDIFIICVPTPVDEDYEPDYGPVVSAGELISKYLKKGNIVVLESTVNPGTCDEILIPVLEKNTNLKAGKDFDVVHVPERINPGDKKNGLTTLPRNIGGTREEASQEIKDIYSQFITADLRIVSNLKVAEASKIVENSFRDINIAFVNELAKSFDAMEIDLIETIEAASSKFSFMPHWPGPGVGGHCIAVDPYYLIKRAHKAGFNHRLLKEAREVNNSMPDYTIAKLSSMLNHLSLPLKGTTIGLLGLSYKPQVGDLRESPSLVIQKKLKKLGVDVLSFDPFLPEISDTKSLDEVLKKSKVVLILTAHNEFKEISEKDLKKNKVLGVVDARNCLNKKEFKNSDILYTGIGR